MIITERLLWTLTAPVTETFSMSVVIIKSNLSRHQQRFLDVHLSMEGCVWCHHHEIHFALISNNSATVSVIMSDHRSANCRLVNVSKTQK